MFDTYISDIRLRIYFSGRHYTGLLKRIESSLEEPFFLWGCSNGNGFCTTFDWLKSLNGSLGRLLITEDSYQDTFLSRIWIGFTE